MEPQYVAKHFVPLALDTYFRGNSHELEFCQKVRAGGNHLVVASAGGQTLGKGQLKLRQKDLEGPLKDRRLPIVDPGYTTNGQGLGVDATQAKQFVAEQIGGTAQPQDRCVN